jgi:hypothetical protein
MIRPTQRTYGKGMGRGKKVGRIQGAAAGGFSVAALSGLSIAQLKKKLEQAETARQRAAVKAAIERAMREIAQKDAAKAKMGKVKPKIRPPQSKAKGGSVKKFDKGGSNEQQKMEEYKKGVLLKLQKEYGKKAGLSLFKEMDEMGYFRKGGAVKRKGTK